MAPKRDKRRVKRNRITTKRNNGHAGVSVVGAVMAAPSTRPRRLKLDRRQTTHERQMLARYLRYLDYEGR